MAAHRLIAIVRFKNEQRMLPLWLVRITELVDGIVALDDGSTDDSYRIVADCPKTLHIVRNEPGGRWDELRDRNRLLQIAGSFRPEWLIHCDPDEILDARLSDALPGMLAASDVGCYQFREVTLWRGTTHYRVDQPEAYHRDRHSNSLVRYSPELRWVAPGRFSWKRRLLRSLRDLRWHRLPRAGYQRLDGVRGRTEYTEFVRLHYHFVDWDRCWYTHLRYGVRYSLELRPRPEELHEITRWAIRRMDETGLELAPVRPEWGVLPYSADERFSVDAIVGPQAVDASTAGDAAARPAGACPAESEGAAFAGRR